MIEPEPSNGWKQIVSIIFISNVQHRSFPRLSGICKRNKKLHKINKSTDAVQLLRYFYEESPEIHVIVAGSLLETMINRHISYYLVSQISKIISCQL
ncbi:MAG TPA: hypothetical protein VIK10_08760 [Prolixibacteraceae bacterium]